MILDDLCRLAKRCLGIVLQVFVRDINASLPEIRKIGGGSSTMYSHSITLHPFPPVASLALVYTCLVKSHL